MQTLIENLKNQSIKSVLLAIFSTALIVLVINKFESFILLDFGNIASSNYLISGILETTIDCLIIAMLIPKKGVLEGVSIGFVIFFLTSFSIVFSLIVYPSSTTSIIPVIISSFVAYILPGAILGYFRKS